MADVKHADMVIPKLQPFSWMLGLDHLYRIRRDQLGFYQSLNEQYGDAVRIRLGPYRVWLLFHPDPVEALLTRESASFIRFEKLMNVLAQWNGDSLLLAEGEAWRQRRRKVMPAFQTRRLSAYGQTVVELTTALSRNWQSQVDERQSISLDIDAAMARLALDIARVTLFGEQSNDENIEAAIQVLSQTAFRESTSPGRLPDWLPLPAKREKRWAVGVLDRLVTGIVEARLRDDDIQASNRNDLLSILVEHHQRDAKAIRDDSVSLLIAGHETSGALFCWIFSLLCQHPVELDLTIAEIDQVLQGRAACYEDLPKLVQVRAVIAEALRIYPPAYALFSRRAVANVDLAGLAVKKGDLVQIVPYTMHHRACWFGEPERFNPARFLSDPTWPQYAYLPFGAGPRVCIGQNFALMEACLVVATLLQRWRPVQCELNPRPDPKFSLRPAGGMPMRWQPRP